jgi:O-antigen ligase
MNATSWRARIPAVNSALLAVLFFLVPTKISLAYAVSSVMLMLWIAEGQWRGKWTALRSNPVFLIFQAYFLLYVVSLAWTADLDAGRSMVMRHLLFVLAAVYFTTARREHITRYLAAFALGVLLCELLAGYNWLQMNRFPQWPAGLRAAKDAMETAPFVDRIMFGPIVAFAGYVALWQVLRMAGGGRNPARAAWFVCAVGAVLALCISGSRTGLLAYAVLMALLTWQSVRRHRAVAGVAAALVLLGTAGGLYALGDNATRNRITAGFAEAADMDHAVNLSVPLRYVMATNTLLLIAEHPWAGVGAGDFSSAYQEVSARRTPGWNTPRNPHNQLLFTVATTGVFGGLLLLAVWFAPPWWLRQRADGLASLRVALPVFFFTICLAESYLWRSNTGLLFALFSALLYGPPAPRERLVDGKADTIRSDVGCGDIHTQPNLPPKISDTTTTHYQGHAMQTTASGLQFEDTTIGTGEPAKAGQHVDVHYTGWLYSNGVKGAKFDSSKDRGDPFSFGLGGGQVIKGWDEGVQGMRVGGTRMLVIPPELGYGARGAGGVIPPNATLMFEVELLGV